MSYNKKIWCLLLLNTIITVQVLALESKNSIDNNTSYEDLPLGGPASVSMQMDKDREAKGDFSILPAMSARYSKFKKMVDDEYGLNFGFDYNVLMQTATQSLDDKTAAGGVFRMYGEWSADSVDRGNSGSLIYKVENRHRLGTDIPPSRLGAEIGYAGMTAVTFSDIGWALTNLHWSQRLYDNRLGFVIGIVDTTDYVDVYGLVNIWTEFNNYAFTTNPTIPAPNQGLGAALRIMATENIYILGGIADANGDPTSPENTFDSFLDESEFFSHIELGWALSWERRFSDNIHLTAWHQDAREKAQTPDGWGMAFSFSRLLDEAWEPFFRAGFAKGSSSLWEYSISTGTGHHFQNNDNMLGLGLNWSRPSEETFGSGLNDQYTAEFYYRFQILKRLSITPDIQLVLNPALNPKKDTIAVFGLRARFSF
ncbi:carbohydrate porin [Campylobacterota bacterium]